MKKIRDLRLLIGAAALATAGTSAAFAIVAAVAPVGVQADPLCYGVWVNGSQKVLKCVDPGSELGAACFFPGVQPQLLVEACIPD